MSLSAAPPAIDGFDYLSTLGGGGFADVYLYQQKLPRRRVAIKVIRVEAATAETRRAFTAEANLMAQLSTHPSIATIYSAGSTESGRLYLVMEYCSGGSLASRYRNDPLPVEEALRIGIRMASALEAAHRFGIVHRDVKPANILLTDYGTPALADFGISIIDEEFPEYTMAQNHLYASQLESGSGDSSFGFSVPWASPESLDDDPVSDARSDVFSLAATLFSLVEGRSPFESPDRSNNLPQMISRIQRGEAPAWLRDGVAPEFRAVIERGLAHDRDERFGGMVAFAEAMQATQTALGQAVTPLEIASAAASTPQWAVVAEPTPAPSGAAPSDATLAPNTESAGAAHSEIDDETVVRPRAAATPPPAQFPPPGAVPPAAVPPVAPLVGEQTVIRSVETPEPAKTRVSPLLWGIIGGAALLLVLASVGIGLIVSSLGGGDESVEPPVAASTSEPEVATEGDGEVIAGDAVVTVAGKRPGQVYVTIPTNAAEPTAFGSQQLSPGLSSGYATSGGEVALRMDFVPFAPVRNHLVDASSGDRIEMTTTTASIAFDEDFTTLGTDAVVLLTVPKGALMPDGFDQLAETGGYMVLRVLGN